MAIVKRNREYGVFCASTVSFLIERVKIVFTNFGMISTASDELFTFDEQASVCSPLVDLLCFTAWRGRVPTQRYRSLCDQAMA